MGTYIESKLLLQNIGWENKYYMHDSDGEWIGMKEKNKINFSHNISLFY